MERLAILGGERTKQTPFGTGRRFGEEELVQLREAIEQDTLFYWHGKKVKQFTRDFAEMYGMPYCVAASSGTAAIHVALGTLGVGPGDEVITAPITDMGSLIGIMLQGAIPVFADLDAHTYNMTADSVEACLTSKTKAILAVHLAGNPCDMDPIVALAKKHGLRVVEDCAQSYLSYYRGRLTGTIGDIGCFSVNDYKHISAGDGGMVLLRDEESYVNAHRFADKGYDRLAKDPVLLRAVNSLSPCYRMTELQGAVGIAQLKKLKGICDRRRAFGDALTEGLRGLDGIVPPKVLEGCASSYWFYMLRVDEAALGVSRDRFCEALTAEGIPNKAGYIPNCVYEYGVFTNKNAFPGTAWPFDNPFNGREITYRKGLCPTAEAILQTAVSLPVSEFYTDQDLNDMIAAVRKVALYIPQSKGYYSGTKI